MLKTLDILIGATTVLLLFSLAVTVITEVVTNILGKRGAHLLNGLSSLLQQLGIPAKDTAKQIAEALLKHPMVASAEGKLGTVIHRQEFTNLLLDIASEQGKTAIGNDALTALKQMLKNNGIDDPAQTLKKIRAMTLVIETSHPDLATHAREDLAILREAASDYVAKVHSWFDPTIDRVSQSFTKHAQRVTIAAAFVVVLVVQFDIIGVVDRLSIDDQFRNAVVGTAASALNDAAKQASTTPGSYNVDPHSYYNLLNNAGLVTMPTNSQWVEQIIDPRKYPGMVISILLISLGAPFWYNILKDLLGMRSALAQKDDQQRIRRQTTPPAGDSSSSTSGAATTP